MKKPDEKQLWVFGCGLPLTFLFLAWCQYAKHGVTIWVIGFTTVAVLVLAMACFAQPQLKILFQYWMKVAGAIGSGITVLILTLFFFVVITPISVILRFMGKDFMNLHPKSRQDSYWIKKEKKISDYTQQF